MERDGEQVGSREGALCGTRQAWENKAQRAGEARVGELDATHSSSIFTNVTAEYIKRSITRRNGTVSVAGLRRNTGTVCPCVLC